LARSRRGRDHWDDLASSSRGATRPYFLLVIAVYAAARIVTPSPEFARVLRAIGVVLVLFQAGVWAMAHWFRRRSLRAAAGLRRTSARARRSRPSATPAGSCSGACSSSRRSRISGSTSPPWSRAWVSGGIAIALALQNILGDLFAALAIRARQAFIVGDAIQVDTINGTIEHVGLKTTASAA